MIKQKKEAHLVPTVALRGLQQWLRERLADCRAGVVLLTLERHGPAIQEKVKMVVRSMRHM